MGVNRAKNGASQATEGTNCKTVQVVQQFDFDRYVRDVWYSVKQLPVSYQREDEFYCTRAQYLPRGAYPGQLTGRGQGWFLPRYHRNAFARTLENYFAILWGWELWISNQGNVRGYNGQQRETLGFLCGAKKLGWPGYREDAKLTVSPCFLPKIFGGPYWVIYHNETYRGIGAAVIVGGQPNRRTGNGRLCDYASANDRTCRGNNACLSGGNGMWFFSRQPIVDQAFKDGLMTILNDAGLDGANMLDIDHGTTAFQECRYAVNHKDANGP